MTDDLITVFGGSGFLGQDVIRVLLARGHTVRLVARHPQRPRFDRDQEKRLQRRAADIRDPRAVRDAVAGSRVVINAVSLYTQRGDLTFEAIHVRGAAGLVTSKAAAEQATGLEIEFADGRLKLGSGKPARGKPPRKPSEQGSLF